VTLTDVARHCGVSRATVSLVLNNSPLVAAATAARVREAMSELGYVYNRAAASLRTRRTNAIGVVLTQVTNPYFAELAAGPQDTWPPASWPWLPSARASRCVPRPGARPRGC
jgi:LacI family transcriptional regulator